VSEAPPKPRILSLSDLIFGLALSISALTLIGHQPANADEFFASLALYGFSFLIIISVWRIYSTITSILPSETSTLSGLNYMLLFLVSIEPYLFNELFTPTSFFETVNEVYAIELGIMFLILAAFNHILASEERKLVAKALLRRYRLSRNLCVTVAGIFIVSAFPLLGSTIVFNYVSPGVTYQVSARTMLWTASLIVGWARHLISRAVLGGQAVNTPT